MDWIAKTLYPNPELTTALAVLGYLICLGYLYVEKGFIWHPRMKSTMYLVDFRQFEPYQMYIFSKRNFKWLLWAGLFAIGLIVEAAVIIGAIMLIKMIP